MLEHGGEFESVSDEEAFRAMHILAKMEGISVEPAAAVSIAGLIKLVRSGIIKPSDMVVVNCTGHTMPIEKIILGESWERNINLPSSVEEGLDPDTILEPQEGAFSGDAIPQQEGLLAALSRVTDDRFSHVLIVDDTEEARRLIRRILQSQGEYQIFEAADGHQALEIAQQELPELIILDLMMPELDGFAVLDALKADPRTAQLPVIVVTAKELSKDEKQRLSGRIKALMQKGEFMNDELLQEVQTLVK
jgi:threonine synthase